METPVEGERNDVRIELIEAEPAEFIPPEHRSADPSPPPSSACQPPPPTCQPATESSLRDFFSKTARVILSGRERC
ncbi:hypothetical protein OUZ56_013000 [Daphnia magna]|uniref:Uncharacterized protein n=1 Tax=Daphnia magna TaxID=35525 RepID=A0ABQ9Z4L7_9CRUS|nr:hypothetical protein OUZ56_013000 [Daphnia magna]